MKMSLHINVPEIAITPEAEEDDDNYVLSLAEALTDIEELFEENASTKKHCYRKKLKIKVTETDGYNTAMEDIEASDDEEIIVLKQHNKPIALDKLDMEQYTAEENYGVNKNDSANHYLNLQSSFSRDALRPRRLSNASNLSALTDIEDYDTENEVEEEFSAPEIDIHLDSGESMQTIKISDEFHENSLLKQEDLTTDCVTPHTSTNFPITLFETPKFTPPRKRAPTFSQMMKAKPKSNDNKMRRKKRTKNSQKISEPKDAEDSESSSNECLDLKNRKSLNTLNSLNYESDLDEENKLPFPLCKKTFSKKQNNLKMPEFDTHNITDVEDVDCDVDVSRRRLSVDGVMFQKQLDEMASCYSFTKDKNESREKDTEPEKPKEVIQVSKREPSKVILKPITLNIPTVEDGGSTDVENLNSSSDNDESETEINLNSSDTEEESFNAYELLETIELPDIPLPPPARLLVISEENKSLIPTVRILPLDEHNLTDSDVELPKTDDESFESDEEIYYGLTVDDDEIRIPLSPTLPDLEGGSINVSEDCIQKRHQKMAIEEVATDIEDLEPDEKVKKEKKLKKHGRYLVPNNTGCPLTDVEDLDMSADEKSGTSLLSLNSDIDGLTDIENLDTDDEKIIPTVKERLGLNIIQNLIPPILILPGHTDTEDIAASTDDEYAISRIGTETPNELRHELDQSSSIEINIESSSKIDYSAEEVMYLKGGGFQEILTDTEELELQQEVMEAWEYFNVGGPEWDASKEEIINVSKDEPRLVSEEIKGDAAFVPRPSETAPFRGETDEPTSSDRDEGSMRSQQMDQHQISEEMKELLREMEKSSKQ